MSNCEAAGSGDSGLYPGAGADTGVQREAGETFRYSQRITRCDSHHNVGGYSGTDGNATQIDHNNFYDNALGFTTDVFTAPGHPGFPQDSDLVEFNNFYDNNYNPYKEAGKADDVQPSVPVPVGTGMWIAGGNDNMVRNNHFWGNYRRAVMLFAAPDAVVCGPTDTPVTGCDPNKLSTSYRNSFTGNVMGMAPDGTVKPNGQDFWWDAFPSDDRQLLVGQHDRAGREAQQLARLAARLRRRQEPGLERRPRLGQRGGAVGCFSVVPEPQLRLAGLRLVQHARGTRHRPRRARRPAAERGLDALPRPPRGQVAGVPDLPLQARQLRRALIGGAAVLALAGCGGADRPKAQQPAAAAPNAPTLALADCNEWHEMRQSTRHGFVTQIEHLLRRQGRQRLRKGTDLVR